MATNPTTLTERGERTRRDIIDAAIEVFGESGESRTSLSEIARRCGRSSQALYRYFPGRRELFEAAARADDEAYSHAVAAALEGVRYPYLTNAHWRAAVQIIPRFPLVYRIYRSGAMDDLDLLLESQLAVERRSALAAELRLGQAAGVVRSDIDADIVAEWTYRIAVQMKLPRIFAGEPRDSDVAALGYLMASAVFAPMPDLSTPEKRTAFEAQMVRALDAASGR